jgi:Protein of unknown function (DUF2742)
LNGSGTARRGVSSTQVAWYEVQTHVAPILEAVGSWPLAGTPEWVALPDDDPAKLAALLDAARHWSLRLDSLQEASAEASRDVSAAADWSTIATAIFSRHNSPYIPREVA